MKSVNQTILSAFLSFMLILSVTMSFGQEESAAPAEETKTEESQENKKPKEKQKEKAAEPAAMEMSSNVSNSSNNPQIQNKSGVDIMPVKGEFAIGMSANPFLQFAGNLFGLTGSNTALSQNKFFQGSQLFAKYMLSDDNAVRLRFRAFANTDFWTNEVYDDLSTQPEALVEDKYTSQRGGLDLVAGYEWRRGKGRFRVVYGGEVAYSYNRGFKETYSYGNDFSASNQAPTSTVSWNTSTTNNGIPDAERLVSRNGNSSNLFGLRGFAGVEYYFMPKLCVGTEFGWGANYILRGERIDTFERFEVVRDEITQRELKSKGINELNMDTDNLSGTLFLLFYF